MVFVAISKPGKTDLHRELK